MIDLQEMSPGFTSPGTGLYVRRNGTGNETLECTIPALYRA